MSKKIVILLFIFFALLPTANAAPTNQGSTGQGESQEIILENPIANVVNDSTGKPNINIFIGRIIQYSLGIVGSIALAMFIYGGFLWMLSAGNNEQVQKGKNVLMWASVGLVIIFASYTLVRFVLTSLQGTA